MVVLFIKINNFIRYKHIHNFLEYSYQKATILRAICGHFSDKPIIIKICKRQNINYIKCSFGVTLKIVHFR